MAGFGTLSPGEEAELPPNILDKIVAGGIKSVATLPQRAIQAAAVPPGLRREDMTDILGTAQPADALVGASTDAAMNMIGAASPFASAGAVGAAGGKLLAKPYHDLLEPMAMDETSRLARAQKQGFTVDAFHGTTSEFPSFERIEGGNARGDGFYFSTSPESASRYATGDVNRISPTGNANPNVMPVKLRTEQPFHERSILTKKEINKIEKAAIALGEPWEKGELAKGFDRAYLPNGSNVLQYLTYDPVMQNKILRASGYDSRVGQGIGTPEKDIVIFDPKNIRSRFAKFDPREVSSRNLLAGGAGIAGFGSLIPREDR